MSGRRGSISEATTRRLWVLAGGRCEYHGCNKYLLEDELSGYTVPLGERAHIVGASAAPGSPRGDDPLPVADRDHVDNLMLLCGDHHDVIDKLIEEHSREGLRAMKRAHEARIRQLTSMQDDASTVIVRAVGGIRNAPVAISAHEVGAAVRADGRYPRFDLALAGEDLEIDLRHLPDEGHPDYWRTGERIIATQIARLRDAQSPIRHLSVFALTRIPLLVALGYDLDDKIPTEIYGRRRSGTGDDGWGYDPDAEPVEFEVRHVAGPTDGPHVAVAASVTAPIATDVVTANPDHATYEIAPRHETYGPALLGARASLQSLGDAYSRLLGRIEADHPHCPVIDLHAAIPVAGAVQLGRAVMRDTQPALRIHDRDHQDRFVEALTLGNNHA